MSTDRNQRPTDRPNILLLFTDQQRFDTIRAAGYSHMKTPNLDRLVGEGCLFENAYTPNPICVPARYSLLTGVTEAQHNIVGNNTESSSVDGLATLPRVLSDNGYFTAAVGKMHFHPPRRHHGFLEMHLMEEIPGHRCDDAYAEWLDSEGYGDVRTVHGSRPLIYHEPQRAVVDDDHHGSAWVATRTIELIERNQGRRPFYIHAGWINPHPPWNITEKWWGHYDGVDLPDPIPGPRLEPHPTEHSAWFGDDDSNETVRRLRAAYYTTISMIDDAVGRILRHLEEQNILDNTLVIFTSDHGEMLADHAMYQKMLPYESSTRIPFVVRWPARFAAGSREDRFVDLLDIMPTALDAAGIDPQTIRSGRPYSPGGSSLLRLDETGGRDRRIQRSAHGALNCRWVMVRDKRYKYVHFADGGREWFFDLESDPEERVELVSRGSAPEAELQALRKRSVELEQALGPDGGVVDGRLFERPASSHEKPSLTGKFPAWANRQMPEFGDGSPDEEAMLLSQQISRALSWAGPSYASEVTTERQWFEHFLEMLEARGVSNDALTKIAADLGLQVYTVAEED
jgi:choline-sulfatase